MPKTYKNRRLEEEIIKRQSQLEKIEARISPLMKRKQKLISDIRSLENKQTQVRYSEILGVITGIEGIDQLSPNNIQEALEEAAQYAKSQRAINEE